MAGKKYYIGERSNPQFARSYYVAYGQLTKKDATKKETTSYGGMTLIGYTTQEEFDVQIELLRASGLSVRMQN